MQAVSVRVPIGAGPLVAGGVALATILSAFVAQGGMRLERTTWTEVWLMLAGAALVALAIVFPRPARTPERLRGAWVVGAFGLFTVLTAVAISWSLTPGTSWLESSRVIAYLATLAGGVALGRLAPGRWSAVLAGTIVSAVVICGWALLTKVFPAAFAPDQQFARLQLPFVYWNAVGLAAVLGIPPLLWLAARRSGHAAVNALAWPGLGLLVVCVMLSYSRGALIAVGFGLALWLAVVPLRLRAITALGCVLVVTVPLILWAFAQDGLSLDGVPLSLRTDAGLQLGALLLMMVVTLSVAGLATGFLTANRPPGEHMRARATRALVIALAAVPAVAILMLSNAPGGIGGQVSKAWQQATDPNVRLPSNSPDRLAATSSVRARYWNEAWKVHEQNPWLGSGPGSYATQRLRYRIDGTMVQHAHGYTMQVLSDLGWVGLGLSLFAMFAWLVAAARAIGLRPRDRDLPWDAERVGVATLATVALVFGVHSALDWTWYMPGNVVPALICAGWVASRGPLRERMGLSEPEPDVERIGAFRPAIAGLVLAIAVLSAWSALQPVRAVHASDAAYARFEQGGVAQAVAIARIAHERNPLALEPLFDIATFEQAAGNNRAALRALEQAVRLEPANAVPWQRLGRFQLYGLKDAKAASRSFGAAFFLDKRSRQIVSDFILAQREINGG